MASSLSTPGSKRTARAIVAKFGGYLQPSKTDKRVGSLMIVKVGEKRQTAEKKNGADNSASALAVKAAVPAAG